MADAGETEAAARTSDEGEAATPATRLCRACGLCCDGTVFVYVPVTEEEARRLVHRLPILPATDRLEARFDLRCPAHGAGGCSIYEERPDICAQFRCKLLRRLEAGTIDLDDARVVVARVRALAERLDAALPPGKSRLTRVALLPDPTLQTSRDLALIQGEALLDAKVLDLMIRRELYDATESKPESPPPTDVDPAAR